MAGRQYNKTNCYEQALESEDEDSPTPNKAEEPSEEMSRYESKRKLLALLRSVATCKHDSAFT